MATIQVAFTHPSQSYSRTFNVADADLVRMVTAAREQFYRRPYPTQNGLAGDQSPPTGQQALERLTLAFFKQLVQMTKDHEAKLAVAAAEASVSPITET